MFHLIVSLHFHLVQRDVYTFSNKRLHTKLMSFILTFLLHPVRMLLLLLILTLLPGLLTSPQEPPHPAPSQGGNIKNGTAANITIEPGNIITAVIAKTTLIGKTSYKHNLVSYNESSALEVLTAAWDNQKIRFKYETLLIMAAHFLQQISDKTLSECQIV